MRILIRLLIGLLFVGLTAQAAAAHHLEDWPAQYRYYYPNEYISPARTGLPSNLYFYPNQYYATNGYMTSYLKYTRAAYSYQGLVSPRGYYAYYFR